MSLNFVNSTARSTRHVTKPTEPPKYKSLDNSTIIDSNLSISTINVSTIYSVCSECSNNSNRRPATSRMWLLPLPYGVWIILWLVPSCVRPHCWIGFLLILNIWEILIVHLSRQVVHCRQIFDLFQLNDTIICGQIWMVQTPAPTIIFQNIENLKILPPVHLSLHFVQQQNDVGINKTWLLKNTNV